MSSRLLAISYQLKALMTGSDGLNSNHLSDISDRKNSRQGSAILPWTRKLYEAEDHVTRAKIGVAGTKLKANR